MVIVYSTNVPTGCLGNAQQTEQKKG